jgi:prepilin-type processing-associated H-X9-DG protein
MRRNLSVVLVTVLCCAAGVRAQTLADRVPADAIAYLGWKGADSPDNGYAGSHLQAIIDASGFAQLRDQLIPQLMQKVTQQSKDNGEAALMAKTVLGIVWRHPTAVFFAGMTQDATGKPAPKLGLIIQAGTDSDALMTIFNAATHGPDAAPLSGAFTIGDSTVFLIGYASADAIPSATNNVKSLKADEDFSHMTAETGQDPLICGYLDGVRSFAAIDAAVAANSDDSAKDMWIKARDASGLTGLKHASFGAGFNGRDWQQNAFIDAPAPRTGLLTVFEPTPIDPALLARIPSSATSAAICQFNVGELLRQIRAIIIATNPAAGDIFDKGMGIAQMMVGRNLQRDILDPLGSQWATYTDASIPAPVITATQPVATNGMNLVIVNKLVDPAKAKQGWTMLSYAITNASAGYLAKNHVPVSMATTQSGDLSVFTITTPLGQPSWTFKDGYMYLGLSADGVIPAANAASGTPVTQQAGFADLAKQLDPSGAFTEFQYANLPTSVPQAYPATETGIEKLRSLAKDGLSGAGFSITLPDHILPPLDKLLPELTPALAVSWADASGWHSRSREPFPGSSPQSSLTTVGGAALGVSILLPSLNRARETANRVKCASNERQIGQGILLWANDHKGQYPPTLGDLATDGDLTPEVFICPSGNTALPKDYKTMAPADLAKWVNEHADYVYVGAGQNTMIGADQVVLYEKPADHTTGMNILFGDGHVEFDVMATAVKQIQDQHKTVPSVPLPGGAEATPAP